MKRIIIATLVALAVAPATASAQGSDYDHLYGVDFGQQSATTTYLPLTVTFMSTTPTVYFSLRHQAGEMIRPVPVGSVRQVSEDAWQFAVTIYDVPVMNAVYRICWRFTEADDGCPWESLDNSPNLVTFAPRHPDIRPRLSLRRIGRHLTAQATLNMWTYGDVRFDADLALQRYVNGKWWTVRQVHAPRLDWGMYVGIQQMRPLRLSVRPKPRAQYRAVFRYTVSNGKGLYIGDGRMVKT